jgi:acetylglutamate kinase
VIVHGGGKDIANALKRLNKEFTFVEGHRVTDDETMITVQMVLSGDVNKRIVNALLSAGVDAAGISGIDCGLFQAEKLLINGRDIGNVGSITRVRGSIVTLLHGGGIVPVISPVSRSATGAVFNVNADLAAGELAVALKADHLIFISDVTGVRIGDTVRHEIKTTELEDFIARNDITGGMIPKVRSAAEAVLRGVKRVHICAWYGPDTLASELSVSTAQGTAIY